MESKTLEEKVDYIETLGTNFNNPYAKAKYKISKKTINLGEFEVPGDVQVLNKDEKWQDHPVVFIDYGNYEAYKQGKSTLIVFLVGGKWTSRNYNPFCDLEVYKQAEKLGLTKGNRSDVKEFPKEED